MMANAKSQIQRRSAGDNVWLSRAADGGPASLGSLSSHRLKYEVLGSEDAVGQAMLDELQTLAREKSGEITIILLGGRGAQALHRLLGQLAKTDEADEMLNRLNVFTQDALAPGN